MRKMEWKQEVPGWRHKTQDGQREWAIAVGLIGHAHVTRVFRLNAGNWTSSTRYVPFRVCGKWLLALPLELLHSFFLLAIGASVKTRSLVGCAR